MFSSQENGVSIFGKWKPNNRLSQSSTSLASNASIQIHSISHRDGTNGVNHESHPVSKPFVALSAEQLHVPKSKSAHLLSSSSTHLNDELKTTSMPVIASSKLTSGSRSKHVSFLRIECLVAAHRVQQTAERLLLSSDMFPPNSPEVTNYETIKNQVSILKLRTDTLIFRVVPSLSNYSSSHSMSLDDASECIRGLETNCIAVIKDVFAYCYHRLSAMLSKSQLNSRPDQLSRAEISESCDNHLSAVYALELSVSDPLLDSPKLVSLCERLSETLAALNKSCFSDNKEAMASMQYMDQDALKHGVRAVTACTSFLLHTVRTVYHQPDDPDCRGRVDLASGALRPSVTAVKHIAGEAKFVGKPLTLSGNAKALRHKLLCCALTLASSVVEFFSCLGSFLQVLCGLASDSGDHINQLQRCAKAVSDACSDCLKLPVQAYVGTEF